MEPNKYFCKFKLENYQYLSNRSYYHLSDIWILKNPYELNCVKSYHSKKYDSYTNGSKTIVKGLIYQLIDI